MIVLWSMVTIAHAIMFVANFYEGNYMVSNLNTFFIGYGINQIIHSI